jgi:hypothetical protein
MFLLAEVQVPLGHDQQGIKLKEGSVQDNFLIFRVVTLNIATAKIAIIAVIFWLPLYHWDANVNALFYPLDHFLRFSAQT